MNQHYILDDADVGTYWYHPHHHPQVQHSVYGGAYGMLIIDESDFVIDNQNYYPNHLANFLTKNEILLQFSSMYNEKSPNTARTNKVNGQENLELFLSPDSYYYFRISSVIYDGVINYVEFDPPGACDVRIVAYDGVYRSEIPGHTLINKHMMTVGSRVDLAVACHKYSHIHFHQGNITDLSKLVTIHLETAESRESPVSPSARNDSTSISVRPTLPSSPYWDIETETIWRPRRPYYMPDLSAPTNVVDDYWSVSMDDHFANGTHGHLLNQRKWDAHQSIKTFSLGQLVEYPIFNTQEHPYHSHINRMQIVEPGGCGGRFEEGEYFDTIFQAEKNPGGCRIRTKFFDFAGRVVIHCHRFEHEDHGMMAVSMICQWCFSFIRGESPMKELHPKEAMCVSQHFHCCSFFYFAFVVDRCSGRRWPWDSGSSCNTLRGCFMRRGEQKSASKRSYMPVSLTKLSPPPSFQFPLKTHFRLIRLKWAFGYLWIQGSVSSGYSILYFVELEPGKNLLKRLSFFFFSITNWCARRS